MTFRKRNNSLCVHLIMCLTIVWMGGGATAIGLQEYLKKTNSSKNEEVRQVADVHNIEVDDVDGEGIGDDNNEISVGIDDIQNAALDNNVECDEADTFDPTEWAWETNKKSSIVARRISY